MRTLVGFGVAMLVAGCGAEALPVAQMVPPRENIRVATELGAENNPRAALHLKFARDQVAVADHLLADGDSRGARLALMCADADARLALELAREDKAEREVREVQRKIDELVQRTVTP